MLMNLLSKALPEGGRYASVGEAAIYALIGFAVVFFGITFLIFIVWLVGKIMAKTTNIKTAPKKAEAPKVVAPTQSTEDSDEVSDETVAVIMATLMAYYEKNNSKCEFVVKRIKRL